jgi:peptidoglycan/xylan/chitin deacetylase (PgdA/CDA1 family)
MTAAELRSARLLFASELASGRMSDVDLEQPAIRRAVGAVEGRGAAARLAERMAMKAGVLDYQRSCAAPMQAARQAVLGEAAYGMPRVLLRVDEFPHFRALDEPRRYGTDAFSRFHAILAERGVPYLLAALPALAADPLNPHGSAGRPLDEREAATLAQVADDGVVLALHGFDHRTRSARPRRRSELAGLASAALLARLARGEAILEMHGIERPDAFVAPFNRFDACQYPVLAKRYKVICGGPESVRQLGYVRTPVWRGEAVYVPAYPPLYGTAAEVSRALRALIGRGWSIWVPVVVHWGWEADRGYDDLRELAEILSTCAVAWDVFLAAVDASGDSWPRDRPLRRTKGATL